MSLGRGEFEETTLRWITERSHPKSGDDLSGDDNVIVNFRIAIESRLSRLAL